MSSSCTDCSQTAPAGLRVIARLQQKGINCTSVQNPLTSPPTLLAALADEVID
jgi:hypothetical protein